MPSPAKLGVLAGLAWSAAAAVCNGHSELCDRKYSNITFVGSHDAPFAGTFVADNQDTSVAAQLAQGVRFLQAQAHNETGVVELCHTFRALEDAGPLATYLGTVKTFLDGHPNEVVTLLLTNQDSLPGSAFDAAFENSGIRSYAFVPPSGNLTLSQWPTLGQFIAMGQRLVVFMDFPAGPPVPYILNEFRSFLFETPYAIDRPSKASPDGRMILVNHFLGTNLSGILIPNRDAVNVTNSAASITAQAGICAGLYGKNPNFILLDWMSIGEGMRVQAMMNGLQFIPSITGTSPNATSGESVVTETTPATVPKSASSYRTISPALIALAMLFLV